MGINRDLSCSGNTGMDMILSSSLDMDVIMAQGDGKSHPDQYFPSDNMVCETNLSPRRQPSPLESSWQSIAIGAWK